MDGMSNVQTMCSYQSDKRVVIQVTISFDLMT